MIFTTYVQVPHEADMTRGHLYLFFCARFSEILLILSKHVSELRTQKLQNKKTPTRDGVSV